MRSNLEIPIMLSNEIYQLHIILLWGHYIFTTNTLYLLSAKIHFFYYKSVQSEFNQDQ